VGLNGTKNYEMIFLILSMSKNPIMSNQKNTQTAESIVKEIKRKTRRKFSSEEKIIINKNF